MDKYIIRLEIPDGKVEEILDRLTAAQETIRECYQELGEIGVVAIKKETASGN